MERLRKALKAKPKRLLKVIIEEVVVMVWTLTLKVMRLWMIRELSSREETILMITKIMAAL